MNFHKLMIGFSIGIMLSASIFSLLIPSIEMTTIDIKWLAVSLGFLLGFIFLMIINYIVEKKNKKDFDMIMFSVTIHNIPEVLSVGVCFAAYILLNNILFWLLYFH